MKPSDLRESLEGIPLHGPYSNNDILDLVEEKVGDMQAHGSWAHYDLLEETKVRTLLEIMRQKLEDLLLKNFIFSGASPESLRRRMELREFLRIDPEVDAEFRRLTTVGA